MHSNSYELLPESSAFIPQGPNLTTNVPDIADLEDRTSISIASEGKFWAKIVQKIGGKHIGKRSKWVSFRAEEFKILLQQLPSFNDKLHGLLDNQSQKEIVRVTNNTHMVARGALQINNKVDDLLNPVQALRAFETVPIGMRSGLSPINKSRENLIVLAQFKTFQTTIESGSLSESLAGTLQLGTSAFDAREPRPDESCLEILDESAERNEDRIYRSEVNLKLDQ